MNNDMALYVYDIGSFITNPMVNETSVASICSCCRMKPRTVNSHYADIKALSINHNCGYSYSAVIRIYKSSIMFYVF